MAAAASLLHVRPAVVALDLDGTTLDADHKLAPATAAALRRGVGPHALNWRSHGLQALHQSRPVSPSLRIPCCNGLPGGTDLKRPAAPQKPRAPSALPDAMTGNSHAGTMSAQRRHSPPPSTSTKYSNTVSLSSPLGTAQRRLSMACTGHAHDNDDYNHQRDLRGNCDADGAWSHFAVSPSGSLDYEKWIAFLTETSFTACAPSSGGDPAHTRSHPIPLSVILDLITCDRP